MNGRIVSRGHGKIYAQGSFDLSLWEFCLSVFVANETVYGHETGVGLGVGPFWLEAGLLAERSDATPNETNSNV